MKSIPGFGTPLTRVVLLGAFGFLGVLAVKASSTIALSADGLIRSTAGGFQFPDGTVQQTAAPAVPDALTVQVDCAAGETLTDALALPAEELTVEFSGSCEESLVLRRDRTRLRGTTPGAEIVGVEGNVVSVRGAIDVVLESLTVRGGWDGVTVLTGGAARLEGLTVRDNLSSGVVAADGGQAWLQGVTVEDNMVDGVGAWGDSTLIFGATTIVRRNGRMGVVASGGSDAFAVFAGGQVQAEDNGAAGLLVQLGSSSQGVELQATGNEGGMAVTGQSLFAGTVDLRDNTGTGLFVAGGGNVLLNGLIQDNGAFGFHTDAAIIDMRETTISGNAQGVLFDGARIHVHATAVADPVELLFGTEATFNGGNGFTGGVSCDGTVLVRGDVECTTATGALTGNQGKDRERLRTPVPAPRPSSSADPAPGDSTKF